MIFICPNCNTGFTIPVGDYMVAKDMDCPCETNSNLFIVGELDSRLQRDPDGEQTKIHSTLYELLS